MSHPLDRPIASELSNLVLEKRRRLNELSFPNLHSPDRMGERVARFTPIPNDLVRAHAESLSITTITRDRQER